MDYYKEYEGYAIEIADACSCVNSNKCSNLNSEIESMTAAVDGLDLSSVWKDGVGGTFASVIETTKGCLNDISSSISSLFTESEGIYVKLQQQLLFLKNANIKYMNMRDNEKPSSDDFKVSAKYENGVIVKESYFRQGDYDKALTEWRRKVKLLEDECIALKNEIEKNKTRLSEINSTTVISSSGFTTLEIKYESNSKSVFNIEEYLDHISSNPSQCKNIVNLRNLGVLAAVGTTAQHTFMGWQKVTDKASDQFRLRSMAYPSFDKHSSEYYDEEGFAKIGDRYVVATTTTYGNVGDYIDIEQADGSVIKAIIGDIKNQKDKGCTPYGHNEGKCVVEFVVDCNTWYHKNWADGGNHENPGTPTCHPEWHQDVIEIRNLGNYFDYADSFSKKEITLNV